MQYPQYTAHHITSHHTTPHFALVWCSFWWSWRLFPAKPSWPEAVWLGCLWREARRSLSSPRYCVKTVEPMWSGWWTSSTLICLLSRVSVVTQFSEPTVSVFIRWMRMIRGIGIRVVQDLFSNFKWVTSSGFFFWTSRASDNSTWTNLGKQKIGDEAWT